MAYVTSVNFRIQLNGQHHDVIEGKRGLRQGDLLSPLLFVLSMDYLSRLLKVTTRDPRFKFHPNCKLLGPTHLMFADDLILFCKADPHTLKILMDTLVVFHNTAGLKANLHKSQIVIGGASPEVQNRCL